jgi:hypothetical protein
MDANFNGKKSIDTHETRQTENASTGPDVQVP